MEKHEQRAIVLLQQRRFDLAEQELRLALADDPDNAYLHANLAGCLIQREAFAEATDEARRAIHLDPDQPYTHYTLATVYMNRKRFDEAEMAIQEALRLDPSDADYYSLLAGARFGRGQWQAALEAADQGLTQDPEHVDCTNQRVMALTKLGRTEEANAAAAGTLARDPEDAESHAVLGWTLLQQRDYQKALEHFSEALRLDPTLDHARAGMVEALKAKNWFYGLFLRYFLWMGRLSGSAQWGVIIGLYLGYRLLDEAAERNPEWAPWIRPLLILYIAFAVSTWVASPLFNLLLRLNRFGRHALSAEQRHGSTLVGLLAVPALVCLICWLITDSIYAKLGMIYFGFLILPASAIFNCDAGWPRRCMLAYTLVLASLMPLAFVLAFLAPALMGAAMLAFIWGSVLSGFAANFLMAAVVRH
jgi:tetratricopeptide (TPR) repeat protein